MKHKNSRANGCRGEREAAKFLSDLLGVKIERNARNGKTAADLDIAHVLPNVHVEIKTRESMQLGSKALDDAMEQAFMDSPFDCHYTYTDADFTIGSTLRKRPCVLWKRNRTCWRLSYTCQ